MHIGIVLFNIPLSQSSGSCRYTSDLALALIGQGKVRVTIFTNWSSDRKQISDLRSEGIKIQEIKFPNLNSWECIAKKENSAFVNKIAHKYISAIIEEDKKHKIDLLNVQHAVESSFIGTAIKYTLGIPFVVTCHGSDTYELSDAKYRNKFSLVKYSDAVICVSPQVKENLLLMFNDKSDLNNRIKVIPPGVNRNIFISRNRPKKKQILFAGRLIDEKGIEEAIEVFLKLVKNKGFIDYKFVIAGFGILEEKLKRKYKHFIKNKTIKFVGSLPSIKLVSLMDESKILIFPSKWEEPFGMVVVEALSVGLPVVANDVGCIKEIFSKNCVAIANKNNWSDFGKIILNIISNKQKLESMSRVAKRCVKEYEWSVVVQKIINVYKNVIN